MREFGTVISKRRSLIAIAVTMLCFISIAIFMTPDDDLDAENVLYSTDTTVVDLTILPENTLSIAP